MKKAKSRQPEDSTPENEKVSSSAPPAMLDESRRSPVHSRSHAAHLDEGRGELHRKPAGDLHFTGRKQP